ncbi:MAG TPA: hypothetical protein VGI72_00310 [Gaiellales bacterium]|jgi:photosystem II stability/assembly factor-like uncharacterized protein
MPATASALAIAPDFAGTIWAATGGRVYRSGDGGHTWRRVPGKGGATGVAFLQTHVVTVGPRGVQTGGFGAASLPRPRPVPAPFRAVVSPYYRTNRLYAVSSSGQLWVSVRNASRWARLRAAGLPPGAVAVAAIRDDVHRPDVIYVACGSAGLWRSGDFGATFRRIRGVGDASAVTATTDDQRLLLVASPGGIERSRDSGRSFTRVSPVTGVRAIAYDLRNWRIAYAALGNGTLLRSDDGGRTWDES